MSFRMIHENYNDSDLRLICTRSDEKRPTILLSFI